MSGGPTEDETCSDVVLPALAASGWRPDQIRPQYPLVASRVVSLGGASRELGSGRVDYVLEIVPGLPVATVEAKRSLRRATDGLQQSIRYAQQLDVPTALATNGADVVERDVRTGRERDLSAYPTPVEAWARYVDHHGLTQAAEEGLRQPLNRQRRTAALEVMTPRWYQTVAIHRVLRSLLAGERRVLLLMATGTGKTFTAMQLVSKLRSYWTATDPTGNHRVLYLADRDALLEQPMRKDFVPAFGSDAVTRVRGTARMGRDVYFATYQALSGPGDDETLFHDYPPDFFDLVIVDECHRGSASEQSSWRRVLEHFAPAVQLGLTATPLRDANVDTYQYFGHPLFEYSLRQGIEDGFLAPYRVRRVVLSPDAEGWRPAPGQVDRFGADIPDDVYGTRDFERVVSLLARTRLMARHLSRRLRPDPTARAIIFCQDVEHAEQVRAALVEENPGLVRADPEWVVRIVGVENEKARLLEAFLDPESDSPVVATTSRLLSTGVDVEDLKFVVLFRPVGSMVEFKQIIGRGTRLYPDKGKTAFEIVDYVGASAKFADPEFDGPPQQVREEEVDAGGDVVAVDGRPVTDAGPDAELREAEPLYEAGGSGEVTPDGTAEPGAADVPSTRRKLYVDGGEPRLVGESYSVPRSVDGRLQLLEYGQYVGDQVRRLFPSPEGLMQRWATGPTRQEVEALLDEHGIDAEQLTTVAEMPGADVVDVLRHLAWDLPVPTRAHRASRARQEHAEELAALSVQARAVLEALLDRYAKHGVGEVTAGEALQVAPLSGLGTPVEIARYFGGPDLLHARIDDLQRWLYSA